MEAYILTESKPHRQKWSWIPLQEARAMDMLRVVNELKYQFFLGPAGNRIGRQEAIGKVAVESHWHGSSGIECLTNKTDII